MPRVVFDENIKAILVTVADGGIADISGPTEVEIATGTDLTPLMPKDGLQFGTTNNRVSTGDLASKFNGELMGTWGAQMSLNFFRESTDDVAWDTFQQFLQAWLIVSPFGAPEDGSPVQVYPIETGQREPANSAENERQTFMVPLAVHTEPDLDAVVGGGS
jgi:hypothetical protein